MDTLSQSQAVQAFNNGKGNLFYQLEAGAPAILVNLNGSYGFCYLGRLNRTPKFRGVTASQAVANALKAGRNVIFTEHKPSIKLPVASEPPQAKYPYIFDDIRIGITINGGRTMAREGPKINRPIGLTNSAWYIFAGELIKLLPPVALDND